METTKPKNYGNKQILKYIITNKSKTFKVQMVHFSIRIKKNLIIIIF